jgi:hypothetical protein
VQRKLRKSIEPHKKNTGERATPFVLLVTGSARQAPPHDDLRPRRALPPRDDLHPILPRRPSARRPRPGRHHRLASPHHLTATDESPQDLNLNLDLGCRHHRPHRPRPSPPPSHFRLTIVIGFAVTLSLRFLICGLPDSRD